MHCAAAQIGQGLVFRLQDAVGGDGHVVVGEQRA